jgi:hypothetical protein
VSVLIQYLSLNWPVENGWVTYNSLQLIAYFVTIFIAAPLAFLTRARHVAGTVDPVQTDQPAVQHPTGPFGAFPGAVLVSLLHHRPRRAGVHDRSAAQPQPHLRRSWS